MKTVRFSPKATIDIDLIYDYSEERWGFQQAESYIATIRETCADIPGWSKHRRDTVVGPKQYGSVSCGSHRIWFRETKTRIVIVRVLHQKMDPLRHL